MHRVGILLFALGCATPDATIDRVFDPCAIAIAPHPAVSDALALWDIAPVDAGDALEVRFEPAADAFHGHYDDEHGVIYINSHITDPHALAIVIAHEFGHAFGLVHRSDRPSVMNPGNTSLAPTTDDLAITSSCARPRS